MTDSECKFLCWKGGFFQKFANIQSYAVVYGIIGLVHQAVGSYQVGILSTVEKLFKIPSKISGLIVSGWDIGTLVCVVFLAFYGNKLEKPHAVTYGMLLIASSCLFWMLPHAIYGSPHPETTLKDVISAENISQRCELGTLPDEICDGGDESQFSSLLLILGNIVFGSGACFYWTLGLAYMDDNSKKNKTPILLASTMLIRMLGPTLGFLLASYSLTLPVSLAASPVGSQDPRWIGAWWLGFVPLFAAIVILTIFMWGFPRQLPATLRRKMAAGDYSYDAIPIPKVKGFKLMMKRLLKNKIFMFNTISSTLYVFGMSGFMTFGPKYMELQFQKSSSDSNFLIGTVGLLCTGLGFFISGVVITCFKPNPRSLALWNVVVEGLDVVGHTMFAFLGCPIDNLRGQRTANEWSIEEDCNKFCECPPTIKYSPVCALSVDQLFYSPCHAGCYAGSFNKILQVYEKCECLPEIPIAQGPCNVSDSCNNEFYIYLSIMSILMFFSASGRAGNTLLQFRSVLEEDKAISIGITEGFLSIFAFIPAPIFFGALLDYTCIIWGESCGKEGNCWLYDGRSMRFYLNFSTAGFLFLGTLADVVVWFYSSEIEMYDKAQSSSIQLNNLQSQNASD